MTTQERTFASALQATSPEIAANISGRSGDMAVVGRRPHDEEADDSRQLVDRARKGDRDAFGILYRRHYPSVYRLARFYLDGAEDVAAETFLRAWSALPRYRDTGAPFSAWLYGIARHVVSDARRAQLRVVPSEVLPDRGVEQDGDSHLLVASLLERLSEDQRKVIEMKYLLGMTNPEVSAHLKKSIGAVSALQWRALKSLREFMEQDS